MSINRTNKESNALDKERSILYNSFMNAPAGIAILKGDTHIFEYANAFYEKLIGRTVTKGKTIHEILPEIEKQGLSHILDTVFTTGKPYIHNALPVDLEKKEKGITERYYLNLVVQPLNDSNGNPEKLFVQIIDVTEQVEVRKQIEESELKFKHLTEVIPHMVWTAKPDGKRDYFNKYILDFTGRTFEELWGDGWQKMISPLDLERTLNCWNHCIHTGEPFKIENRWRHHNGSEYWFLTQAIAQKDKDGKILRWIGTNTNITEQKEFARVLEKKVKKRAYQLHIQNETFKHAEESSKKGSYSFNLTTAKLSYSDNLYRILGYEPNEFKPSLEEFNKHVHPEDKEYVASEGQKVLQSKTAEEWQYRMITKTGKVIYIKGTGKVIESNDQLLLVGSLQDVTKDYELNKELQEKEDYLNQVINNAPDAIIVINENSIINLWNPKTEEIFGWKADEVIGTPLYETIVPPQYRDAHMRGMERLLKTGKARVLNKTIELTGINKKGIEFPISLTISHKAQQGYSMFIAFLRDITLEKKNQEQLIVKTKQLEEMNKILERKNLELENSNAELISFSFVASHDLQEPLRKIQTFGKRILETESFSGQTKEYFNRMISTGERMQNLIVSLLDYSQINMAELDFQLCNLNTIVEQSINDLSLRIHEKEAIIEYENLPSINGVRIQIEQLFTNLVDNAIKYSRTGIKPHIKITSKCIHGNTIPHPSVNNLIQYYELKITDNGIGFDTVYANKIFEPFQRLHGNNAYRGTGIGLTIIKKIVANHNGLIKAEGKPDIGSVFTIYLPVT